MVVDEIRQYFLKVQLLLALDQPVSVDVLLDLQVEHIDSLFVPFQQLATVLC